MPDLTVFPFFLPLPPVALDPGSSGCGTAAAFFLPLPLPLTLVVAVVVVLLGGIESLACTTKADSSGSGPGGFQVLTYALSYAGSQNVRKIQNEKRKCRYKFREKQLTENERQ